MAPKHRPSREGELQRLRAQLGAAIRKGSGVNVIMPQVTTGQVGGSRDLLERFLNEPNFLPTAGMIGPAWFVNYEASDGYVPESADVAWTKDIAGTVSLSCSSSICYIADLSTTDCLIYTYTADLSNATGTTLEARIKVTTGDVAVNSGVLLRIADGAQQWDVYCRTGDLNVDDGTDTPASVDLTAFRWLRLAAQGSNLLVSVDGDRLCVGGPKQATTGELVEWGVTSGSIATVQVRDVRAIAGV